MNRLMQNILEWKRGGRHPVQSCFLAREDEPASPPSSLPPRKRKYSLGEQDQVGRDKEEEDRWRRRREEDERDKPVEAGPCWAGAIFDVEKKDCARARP